MSDVSIPAGAVEIDGKDLPAYCPNPAMPIWSSHPRVFLDMTARGFGKCPYCGTVYAVKPGTEVHGH
ncbi:MAG: zinc-finger domain-containing protein [Janthinobacterium lividum]